MRKFFRFVLLSLLFVTLFLALTEGLIHWRMRSAYIQNPGEDGKGTIKQQAMRDYVQDRINTLWARSIESKKYYYDPPFEVYVNRGFEDVERMKYIASRSKLPPNEKVTLTNFLRRDSDSSTMYTVTSNSLGFRGAERTLQKPPKTFRIIVLGSYPAFGHGVNDNETYSDYLEKSLNLKFKSKMKFEVWNGGRQGGSSIMGLARLQYEVDAYKPDLIIWDYGWIEKYLRVDVSSEPSANRLQLVTPNSWQRSVLEKCYEHQNSIAICRQLINKFEKIKADSSEESWRESFERAKAWAVSRHIPLVYMWHPGVSLSEKMFKDAEAPNDKIYYLNTNSCIFGHALTPAQVSQFWSKNNWLTEAGYTKETLPSSEESNLYFVDAIQYNSFSYKRMAECLETTLDEKKILPPLELQVR